MYSTECCLYPQVGFDVTPSETTPLSEVLQMGLDKYLEDLKDISSQASKEYALEKVGGLFTQTHKPFSWLCISRFAASINNHPVVKQRNSLSTF